MPLDLLVPDLLASPESILKGLRLPALERLIARADVVRRPEPNTTRLLASAFALPSPPPVAAIALAADDAARGGLWLRADPVHLRLVRDAFTIHDTSAFGISREEAAALVTGLQAFFASDDLEFVAPVPERWYVRVPEGEAPRTVPLEEALGRNVFGMLPTGTGRINWPSALTEAQMLLSAHEVNALRESEGRPAINGVWFWGEGACPESVATPYSLVYADDPFARGLAALSGARLAPRPGKIADVDAVAETQSVLVVLDQLSACLRRGDESEWRRAAESIEDDWFVEVSAAVDRFDHVRVILPTGRDSLVAGLTPAARWRWLRRRKPLSSHA